MSKKIISLVLVLLMILSIACCLCSCGGQADYPVNILDTKIQEEPQSLVILDKNIMDIVSCMCYDVKLTGRSNSVTQKGIEVVPVVGSETEPDIEKIKEVNADVVFADVSLNPNIKEQLQNEGINVIVFEDAPTKKQLKNLYENIGRVLGGNNTGVKKADEAYEELNDSLNSVKEAIQADAVIKTVCYLYIDNGVLKTMNNGTWGSIILEDTGAINVLENLETDVVDNETLLLSNPDFIFCDNQSVIDYLSQSPVLSELDAIGENTYIVPYEDITMQGYTSLDVIENMLRNMYPEQFSD